LRSNADGVVDPLRESLVLEEVRNARRSLPRAHRALLEQLNVQEAAISDWPRGVMDMYRTLRETPPTEAQLNGAVAVWLHQRCTVAFNVPLLGMATKGLDDDPRRSLLASIAWHEYGHALSITRSTLELRRDGPRLVDLLPAGLRRAVAADAYRRSQLFDEMIATLYAFLTGRIREHGYGAPDFLHPDVLAAFQEVIPWPPTP
jgi:hypothetical protein